MKPTIIKDFPGQSVDHYLKTYGKLPSECYYCSKIGKELRPYGPRGANVCFSCGTSPQHEAETNRNFGALLDEAGPIAVIGEESGPRPLSKKGEV